MKINLESLTPYPNIKDALEVLLMAKYDNRSDLEQIWFLMDKVWDGYSCDNKNYNWDRIGKFYGHPVWLLNGLFIEQDKISMQHRNAISDFVAGNTDISHDRFNRIVDYGGGYGTLARLLSVKDPLAKIIIYEPYPHDIAINKCRLFKNITFSDSLPLDVDCLIATDVIEHVPNPLEILYEMANSVKAGGYLVIANNFYPVIKCHLPATFYLRYTFKYFAKYFGLKRLGPCVGSHAFIYMKIKQKQKVNWKVLFVVEKILQAVFPFMNLIHINGMKVKRFIRRIIETLNL